VVLCRYNNAAAAPVSASEALLSSVSKQAVTFCADRDGDGVIELKEGCLVVRKGPGGGERDLTIYPAGIGLVTTVVMMI
jgi:hypothetical protein